MSTLEHPPATHREQRIRGEKRLFAVENIADVVQRVARCFQYPREQGSDLHDIPVTDALIDIGNLGRSVVRGDDAAVVLLFQFGDAANVIVMMMGDQNIREMPTL